MTYREAIEYLHSLTDYEKRRIERYSPETLDLSRVERLLAMLGNPHRAYPSIHIAGTKGKGSTAAMVESALRVAGYRTGLYTSPHLHTFRERIRVGGELISREDVVALVGEIQPLVAQVPGVTTFEAITAMAFAYFARQGVEVLVAEVGLGGRLDATNVLLPEVAVITSLSLDHTYLLGNTLPEITREKAGIIKPAVPVVSAPQRPEAIHVIEEVSQERQAPLVEVGRDWTWDPGPFDLSGQSFTARRVRDGGSDLAGEYWIPLLGRHQLENGTTAVATLQVLRDRGFDLPSVAVKEGLRRVEWPGRMEVLGENPLVVVDCAHNPYSAQVLRSALETWFPGRKWVLVFGASSDKNIAGMLRALLPITDYLIVTRSQHPRAAAPIDLADVAASVGGGAEVAVNVRRALQRAKAALEPGDGILVTGSIFLVAEAREVWAERNGRPVPENDR
ncbi:MAG TPA: bifunctional folylpolyglutamate synthase/dihydrofolate synthase [Thermoflexia bacterium]|jgi:dihydrofolate synthase/folylpolyglutamate synthase|nr:bifunctional folylpolyglutamate synthase/dihydrofolate synthase [Thermoflexia bacterium]